MECSRSLVMCASLIFVVIFVILAYLHAKNQCPLFRLWEYGNPTCDVRNQENTEFWCGSV